MTRHLPTLLPAVLLTASLATGALAEPRLVDPWPDPDAVGDAATEQIAFLSSDPFAPAEIGHPDVRQVSAQLFLPRDAAVGHPVPAVVLLHGAAGKIPERGGIYGRQLAAMGVAVLWVDTFGSRGDLGGDFTERLLHITETMFITDAYRALRFLERRHDIDAQHVVLAGFSYGGMATTFALYAQMADRLAPPGLRFAGHVAFYAPCIARFADNRTTGAPLLMLEGADDELVSPLRCAEVASDLRGGGSEVTIVTYPGAVHQWDGGMPRALVGRHVADCRLQVTRDGTVRDEWTFLPMSGPFLRRIILGLCTEGRPIPVGRDDRTRARSNADFGHFLARVFAGPPVASEAVARR
jgi:dienelactone hydrolase